MKSYDWQSLDEAGKYEVWSEHMKTANVSATNKLSDYSFFCDLMDAMTSPVVYE